jgi:cytochrome c-type biogenesis protein CcmH
MKPKPSPSIAELKRQLAQLDALVAQGVLAGDAARAQRDRIERAVIDAVRSGAADVPDAGPAAAPRPSRALVASLTVLVLLFGAVGYAWRGNREGLGVGPGDTGVAAAQDGAAGHAVDDAQIEAMVARLAERLKSQPDDAEGWSMLARSYTARGRFDDALPAYRRVVELRPQDAQALADYADGLASTQGRTLEGEPEKLVMRALQLDPANVKALALAGTIAFNRSDFPAAIAHWERAANAAEPGGEFVRQIRGAIAEARQRAGLPALAVTEPAAAPPPVASTTAAAPAATGEAITGRVSLAAALKSRVAPDDTLFIYARAASGSKMPLAILRKKAGDLPLDFRLDDSLAMSPATRLSSARQVIVSARISKSGNAAPLPGDQRGSSPVIPVGSRDLRIEIDETVQ